MRAPWDSEDVKGTQDYDYQKHGKSYKGVSSQKNKAWYNNPRHRSYCESAPSAKTVK